MLRERIEEAITIKHDFGNSVTATYTMPLEEQVAAIESLILQEIEAFAEYLGEREVRGYGDYVAKYTAKLEGESDE